jgi:hypothetical protein
LRTKLAVHYDGWRYFREGREEIVRRFAAAPEDLHRRVQWLPMGVATEAAAGQAAITSPDP